MNELRPFDDPVDGVTLVEASAGTGKTYAIEMLYLRLLIERRLSPEEIVVVTYTNAAAAELRQRVRSRLRAAREVLGTGGDGRKEWQEFLGWCGDRDAARKRLLGAIYGFDRAAISTIHGFCQRVLQEHAFESGAPFDVELIADQTRFVDVVTRDFVATAMHEAPRALVEGVWKGLGFDKLAGFAARVAAQPDLAIYPDAGERSALIAQWGAVFDRAREMWFSESEAILELSSENRGLRKGSVPPSDEVEAGLAAVFAAREPGAASRYANLRKLGRAYLSSKKNKNGRPPDHEFFSLCDELLELEKSVEESSQVETLHELVAFARREIPRRKAEARMMYFDDLLLGLRSALRGAAGPGLAAKLQRRFAAALIDEFQDTDPIQYEIFRTVFRDGKLPLFLIGDPKQSIYSFRGADVPTYIAAGAGARKASLATNWRSTSRVVDAVNQLFRGRDAFGEDIAFSEVKPCGEIVDFDRMELGGATLLWCDEPESGGTLDDYRREIRRGVASRIVSLLESGATIDGKALMPRDVAVLCRRNQEAALMQEELRQRAVPTVLTTDSSVFDTPEAADVGRVLRALVDPRDGSAVRAALCTPLCGGDGDELLAMANDEERWQLWPDRFRRWRRAWDDHGFAAAFRELRDDCNAAGRLLAQTGGERRLTNYLHLAELLQVASREQRNGPQGLLDWLGSMSANEDERGEVAAEQTQIRLESDADAVILTTVHRSKGLEYKVVFLPFLWGAARRPDTTLTTFHDPSGTRSVWVGAAAPDDVLDAAAKEGAAEEMRLTYVALTRAKQALFVVVPASDSTANSPLGALLGEPSRARLEEIAERSEGSIAVEDLAVSGDRLRWRGRGSEPAQPPLPRPVPVDWRVTSFSGLAAGAHGLSEIEEEGRDRDDIGDAVSEVAVERGGRVALADLARGARVGLMMHAIFEHLDFGSDDEAIRALVAMQAEAYRVGVGQVDAIAGAVRGILDAPLGRNGDGFRLADIGSARRLNELEFVLPVSRPGGSKMSAASLADVLAAHRAPAVDPDYADRVRGLGFADLVGFLRGYIDMVFEHGGRWFVVDYKSNDLGPRPSDYAVSKLLLPMRAHHYYLQYLVYVVATHRYLGRRLPGYDYETHFGGVYYLFLRGIRSGDPSSGIYFDRPDRKLVSAISELFEGGDAVV